VKTSHSSLLCLAGVTFLLFAETVSLSGQAGYWDVTQLNTNVWSPSINNAGEIVWYSGEGVFSTTRGKLADHGLIPHLANSGEVVYADWFGGPYWDLISTTRGRLTFGGIIDLNQTDFDVNAQGEVVYVAKDTNNIGQVFSTLRQQITFDRAHHYNPCINDVGEIAWSQFDGSPGGVFMVSTVRGVIPGVLALLDLNNRGDFCYMGNLEGPPGNWSSSHIFSSTHGILISDPNQFQWSGSINDAGTIVWSGIDHPGPGTMTLYQATWISTDTNAPQILRMTASPAMLWPPNHRMVPIKLTVNAVDDMDPSLKARITQVTCNDADSSPADWNITGPLTVKLRATISPKGSGRNYTIVVQCQDANGNASSASLDVPVLRDESDNRDLRSPHFRFQHLR
jgi:hypothetical protein